MAKKKELTDKEAKVKHVQTVKATINDGMNTPVPSRGDTSVRSKSEAAMFKQAENPLGDPDQV
ncbi:hypothetical protein ACVWYN_003545 [Pedobacter sp. UYP24]